jgi:hypothetical protein
VFVSACCVLLHVHARTCKENMLAAVIGEGFAWECAGAW